MCTHRECRRDLVARSDPPGGEHGGRCHRFHHLGPEYDATDLTRVRGSLGALGDDDVHACGLVGQRVSGVAA